MRTFQGTFDARDLRVGLIASRFNESITKRLVDGAADCLARHGVPTESVTLVWVPGAFEIPAAAERLIATGEVDALVCLGVVIRGETAHFDYVAAHAMNGIGALAVSSGVPIGAGILTTENTAQAEDRAGGKMGNKGFEAALAAIEMANLYSSMPKPQGR
ncbi:MAG: 6,7-dimethyl-8-ribityllumazine synthase [Actinomycetota bacterium]